MAKQEPYILFVEDQDDIREAFVLSFRGRCHVVAAASGKEALDQVSRLSFSPQAIISDYRLGDDQSGLEVIASVRSVLGKDVPGVLLSGDTSPETLKQLHDSDVAVLHKPVRTADVRQAIENLGVLL